MDLNLVDQVREKNPIVLTIANSVTPSDVANAVNLIGASPIMSKGKDEAEDMTNIANAVVINLGTVDRAQYEEMNAIMTAKSHNIPAIFDPVACGASKYRFNCAKELLDKYDWAVIRGNAGEIATLAGVEWNGHGIDSGNGDSNLIEIAEKCANKYHCIAVATGAEDVISDGNNTSVVKHGSPLFAVHVGTGDMLSSVIGAFAAVSDNLFEAAQVADLTFALAGEIAAQNNPLPSYWYSNFTDNLYKANSHLVSDWQKELEK